MSIKPRHTVLATLLAVVCGASSVQAQGRVELELLTAPRVPLTAQQTWMRELASVGFDRVQIRGRRIGDETGIEATGAKQRPTYRVIGTLNASGAVSLPGGTFSSRDTGKLRSWVANLKEFGPPRAGGVKAEFGLSVDEYEAVRQDLRAVVQFSTEEADPAKSISAISRELNGQVVIEPAAKRAIIASGPVRDQLKGLSLGSALAAILRPAGCALQPRRQGGRVIYLVTNDPEGQIWPIGWPNQKSDGQLVPSLLKREQLQDVEIPLAIGLSELHDRIEVPFLLDHNSLARLRIDPDTTKVNMKAGKAHYGSVLKTLLFQAGLKYEVRADEAEQPFLWITSIR